MRFPSSGGATRTRLTAAGLAAAGVLMTVLAGQADRATAADGPAGRGDTLRRDAAAVRDAGTSSVLAEARDARGRSRTARAGVADLTTGEPVPYGAYYRIGSDTKTFTAVLLLQLVQEGRVSLPDTVEDLLPGLVTGNGNDGSRITVRNLLQQTSGLPDYDTLLFGDPRELSAEVYRERRFVHRGPEDLLALALTQPPEWLPDGDDPGDPGLRWGYSNTNYLLAGMIVEKLTGNPWEQEVHERIIEPLGLRHTLTPGSSAYVPRPTATAYTVFPGDTEPTDTTVGQGGWADGGIISTTADMNTFLRALMDGRLLGEEMLAAMRRTVPAPGWGEESPGAEYGLGIAWRPVAGADPERCPGGGLWFHGGTSFGTVSETGVGGDGRHSAAAAAFTLSLDDRQQARAEAAVRLIDNAVCGTG
ncbi:serine hydrolase domain-containing protein [Streptomyces aidingensis]|uniref:D-alanyl-D-alanine carboxypeptidase n=1 Tax=Streptomyces aidingensis TaxID=910347 RepID=A0A1I1P538_9ACTN|nr:serine hydrolase domain-containing protein [Streptomyces aidingensis]SFD02103.1 D-alanyl-D-alanine carboxypeptidase [Streptomyces aidingensis]